MRIVIFTFVFLVITSTANAYNSDAVVSWYDQLKVLNKSYPIKKNWSDLVELLNESCPIELKGGYIVIGFEQTNFGISEKIRLFNVNKDKLPRLFEGYLAGTQEINRLSISIILGNVGPLIEDGIWRMDYVDMYNQPLRSYRVFVRGTKVPK